MRQPGTARVLVRQSRVAVRDWARALGCTPSAMFKLLEADPRVKQGRLLARLNVLLDDLRDGRARWERDPNDLRRYGRRRRVLVRERTPEAPPTWKPRFALRIDLFAMRLSFVPIKDAPTKPEPPEQPPPVTARDPWPTGEPWNPYGITYGTPEDEEREWLRRTHGREPENPRRERGQGSTFDPPGSILPHRRMRRG